MKVLNFITSVFLLFISYAEPFLFHLAPVSSAAFRFQLYERSSAKGEGELREEIATKNEETLDPNSFSPQNLIKERSYLSVAFEKFLDAAEKMFVSNDDSKENSSGEQLNKQKIVILGSGWASHAFLEEINTYLFDVTVVSPRNYFLMTPMLAASAVGTVEFRSITEPIRNVNPGADYIEATCIDFHSVPKSITCENVVCEGTSCSIESFDVSYDHLIVAVGATSNTFGVKGVREHCIFMKQITDADKLRKAIGNCFERANIPNISNEQKKSALSFVVVGGGPTGVELTAELRDFIEQDIPRFYPKLIQHVSIKLVEASDRVLMAFDRELQSKALKDLTERRTDLIERGLINQEITEVMLNVGVKEITDTSIILSDGNTIPYGLCVWAAGNGPLPIIVKAIEETRFQKEKSEWGRGRLVVDDWLRVKGTNGVYAIGDCCVIDNKALPQTAQVASQQGAYLARLFNRGFDMTAQVPMKDQERVSLTEKLGFSAQSGGKFAKGFAFMNLGILAYTGGGNALAQIQIDTQSVKGSGSLGFFLWRSVYMSKQVSWRNRMLVAIDWAKARIFGRDIVRF